MANSIAVFLLMWYKTPSPTVNLYWYCAVIFFHSKLRLLFMWHTFGLQNACNKKWIKTRFWADDSTSITVVFLNSSTVRPVGSSVHFDSTHSSFALKEKSRVLHFTSIFYRWKWIWQKRNKHSVSHTKSIPFIFRWILHLSFGSPSEFYKWIRSYTSFRIEGAI